MAKVRVRKETSTLFFDFMYRGHRCREQTALPDNPSNRRLVETMARRIKRDMAQGTFVYSNYFPDSPVAKKFDENNQAVALQPATGEHQDAPTLAEFAEIWFVESKPRWRKPYRKFMRSTLDDHLLPALGDKPLEQITRGDILAFRANFAKRPGRGGKPLSPQRVNKVVGILRSLINEGCDRYLLNSPARGIKPLKQVRTDIHPFTLEEIERLVSTVRPDYKPYLVTRFYTGLRTGEINGLQWEDIDFKNNVIEVRRSHSKDGDGGLKTASSRRVVPMVPAVAQALTQQRAMVPKDSPWVFITSTGTPVSATNFANRIWKPLLRHLELTHRMPYQTRHTAATLMLASGENPEWVARVLGHTTTEMLFRVYSRYIPNVTRQDGRAFVGMLSSSAAEVSNDRTVAPSKPIEEMSSEQMRELLHSILGMAAQTLEGVDHENE